MIDLRAVRSILGKPAWDDSVVHSLVAMIGSGSPTISATSMFGTQLLLDF
jgi:hypothetical protein